MSRLSIDGSSSDGDDIYPNLSLAERQAKVRSYLLKNSISTKQHTKEGIPKDIAMDIGKWPSAIKVNATSAMRKNVRPQTAQPASRDVFGLPVQQPQRPDVASLGDAASSCELDEYEVEIEEDTHHGETQFERYLREEREEEVAARVDLPSALSQEKYARRAMSAQQRIRKGHDSHMSDRGVTHDWRPRTAGNVDGWGQAGADGLISDTHTRYTPHSQSLASPSSHSERVGGSAVSNEALISRSMAPATSLPPKFHHDRQKYYSSQRAVQRPVSSTYVKHPPPPVKSHFGGMNGSISKTHLQYPVGSAPHQTRKPFPGNFGDSKFSELRGLTQSRNVEPPPAKGAQCGPWKHVYQGGVRVAPENHPREREPSYSMFVGEDSSSVALHVEQARKNAFFGVNKRPASSLRRGSPLWDTTIEDNLAVTSRSTARPFSSSVRGKTEERRVEDNIKQRAKLAGGKAMTGSNTTGRPLSAASTMSGPHLGAADNIVRVSSIASGTPTALDDSAKNVALVKSKIRARIETAATQAVAEGRHHERQKLRAAQANLGADAVDAPATTLTPPLPQQKLLSALHRGAPGFTVAQLVSDDECRGSSLTRAATPKDYVPRPVSSMSNASEALRALLQGSRVIPATATPIHSSFPKRQQSSSSPSKQSHIQEWFEHVDSSPKVVRQHDRALVQNLGNWTPSMSVGEQTSNEHCAITVLNGKAYLSHKPVIPPCEALNGDYGDNQVGAAASGEAEGTSSDDDVAAVANHRRRSSTHSRRRSTILDESVASKKGGRPLASHVGLRGADSEGSSDWEIDESDEDEQKYDLKRFASPKEQRGGRVNSVVGGGAANAEHSIMDAVEEYLVSHQQKSGADADHTIVTRRQKLNRLKKKQLAQKKLQSQVNRNAEHAPGVIHGAVQLPVYLTSRFSQNASVTWDMSMEKPLRSTAAIEAEKNRFEE